MTNRKTLAKWPVAELDEYRLGLSLAIKALDDDRSRLVHERTRADHARQDINEAAKRAALKAEAARA